MMQTTRLYHLCALKSLKWQGVEGAALLLEHRESKFCGGGLVRVTSRHLDGSHNMINTIFKGIKMYTIVYSNHLVWFLRSIHLETVSNSALLTFVGPSLSEEMPATSLRQAKEESRALNRKGKSSRVGQWAF